MTDLYAQLEDVNRQVAEAQQRIEEQRVHLLNLQREGRDPTEARITLRGFEMALARKLEQRDRLLRALVAKQH